MNRPFRPLLAVPALPQGTGIRFLHPEAQYDIGQFTDAVWAILALCNGKNTTAAIVAHVRQQLADVSAETIEGLIGDLAGLGVLADGPAADRAAADSIALLTDLSRRLVGRGKPVRAVKLTAVPKPRSGATFFAASAVFGPAPQDTIRQPLSQRTSGGTAASAPLALVKAIAEAYEHYASGLLRVDVTARARELSETWLDPRRLVPLTDRQYSQLPFLEPFTEAKLWQWVRGFDVQSGDGVLVPIDLVFCPLEAAVFGRRPCYEASSSGVAAYTDEPGAIERGLLELIERDAIMRNWFQREPPPCIAAEYLPYHWRQRQAYWRAQGREAYVLDLSDYGVITVLVAIVSDSQYPCFAAGAAASCTSFDEAVAKAFHEAESGLLDALAKPKTRRIGPAAVADPLDHAKLYNHPDQLNHIRWLWSSKKSVPAPQATATFGELINTFKPVAVKLSPADSPLSVVRVLSDRLVPINFGFGTEHYSHPAISDSVNPDGLILPHYFA